MLYLISPFQSQFKANLHCHSTCSDGAMTPIELKKAYRERGYHILAITDHESPKDHSALSDDDFLMLTGYEAYIRPDEHCRYDVFSEEIHLNLFARDPHNETLICYNPAYCKYLTEEQCHRLKKSGSQRTREYTVEYINEYIRTAVNEGYLVAYNHPVWSMESSERIRAYEGCFSMEMINGNSDMINNLEYNGALYDQLLRAGKRLYVHAGDDNHNRDPLDSPYSDSFRAATMVLSDSLSYDAVIAAMESGRMYSTSGPVFKEISFDGERITVECSDAVYIACYFGSKSPEFVRAGEGESLHCATFPLHPRANYIRISIMDQNGRRADTRAYFRNELGL